MERNPLPISWSNKQDLHIQKNNKQALHIQKNNKQALHIQKTVKELNILADSKWTILMDDQTS